MSPTTTIAWPMATLADVLTATIDYRGKSVPKSGEGVPLITAACVRDGWLVEENLEYIAEADYVPWMDRGIPQQGDILFTTEAPLANCCICPTGKYAVGQRVVCLRPDLKKISSRTLLEYLRSDAGRQQVTRLASGSTALGITTTELAKVPIPLIPAIQQGRIDAVSIAWGNAFWQCSRLLEATRKRRAALLQQLLSGKRRFPGFTRPWCRVAIGEVLREVDRPVAMRDDELYRLASVRRNWGGLFEREQLLGLAVKTKNLRVIRAGDFLISHIQAAYGSLALVSGEFDGYYVSDLYTCLNAREPGTFEIRFFSYLAQQARITYLCRVSSNGFFAERLRLNFMPDLFLQQMISIPPTLDEQRKIVDTLSAADREIASLENLLAAYRKQKIGLMQQLLGGQLRVHVPGGNHADG